MKSPESQSQQALRSILERYGRRHGEPSSRYSNPWRSSLDQALVSNSNPEPVRNFLTAFADKLQKEIETGKGEQDATGMGQGLNAVATRGRPPHKSLRAFKAKLQRQRTVSSSGRSSEDGERGKSVRRRAAGHVEKDPNEANMPASEDIESSRNTLARKGEDSDNDGCQSVEGTQERGVDEATVNGDQWSTTILEGINNNEEVIKGTSLDDNCMLIDTQERTEDNNAVNVPDILRKVHHKGPLPAEESSVSARMRLSSTDQDLLVPNIPNDSPGIPSNSSIPNESLTTSSTLFTFDDPELQADSQCHSATSHTASNTGSPEQITENATILSTSVADPESKDSAKPSRCMTSGESSSGTLRESTSSSDKSNIHMTQTRSPLTSPASAPCLLSPLSQEEEMVPEIAIEEYLSSGSHDHGNGRQSLDMRSTDCVGLDITLISGPGLLSDSQLLDSPEKNGLELGMSGL